MALHDEQSLSVEHPWARFLALLPNGLESTLQAHRDAALRHTEVLHERLANDPGLFTGTRADWLTELVKHADEARKELEFLAKMCADIDAHLREFVHDVDVPPSFLEDSGPVLKSGGAFMARDRY